MAAPREILDLIKSSPGLTTAELSERTGIGIQMARTITWVLRDVGIVDGGKPEMKLRRGPRGAGNSHWRII
jgi:DNA-binding IclR family transcriptional regulator